MNQVLEDALVGNLLSILPTATIHSGNVVQGAKPDDIIIKTVTENLTVFGDKVSETMTLFQVSVVNPTTEENILTRNLRSALLAYRFNDDLYYADSVNIVTVDGIVHATVSITYMEINS